jgi:hypothetical protein
MENGLARRTWAVEPRLHGQPVAVGRPLSGRNPFFSATLGSFGTTLLEAFMSCTLRSRSDRPLSGSNTHIVSRQHRHIDDLGIAGTQAGDLDRLVETDQQRADDG